VVGGSCEPLAESITEAVGPEVDQSASSFFLDRAHRGPQDIAGRVVHAIFGCVEYVPQQIPAMDADERGFIGFDDIAR